MRIALILCALAAVAVVFHSRWLGSGVLVFIIFCALFGLADFIHDCFDGHGFNIKGQMRRQGKGKSWIKNI
jgi:hypothetical protein